MKNNLSQVAGWTGLLLFMLSFITLSVAFPIPPAQAIAPQFGYGGVK